MVCNASRLSSAGLVICDQAVVTGGGILRCINRTSISGFGVQRLALALGVFPWWHQGLGGARVVPVPVSPVPGPGLPGLLAGEARQACNDFIISLASALQNLSFFRVPDVADPS